MTETTKPKTGVGTPTPDDSGSYGTSTIPKTSNEGKGGEPAKPATPAGTQPAGTQPAAPVVTVGSTPATPAGVTPLSPGVAPQR
jgi:hypothetical protein